MQCNLMLQFKKICKQAHANGIPNSIKKMRKIFQNPLKTSVTNFIFHNFINLVFQ